MSNTTLPEEYIHVRFLDEHEKPSKHDFKDNLPFAASSIFSVPVKCAKLLTHSEDVKTVVVACLDIEESTLTSFEPGQTFGILARNSIEEVDEIIERLNLMDDANKTFELSLKKNISKRNPKLPQHVPHIGTIYNTLIKYLDIRGPPKKLFLKALIKYTTDEKDRKQLEELCSKENSSKYTDFITQNYITLLELLKRFKSCYPPFSLLLEHLPKLQPRAYSIACVPNLQCELKFIFSLEQLPNNYTGVCSGQLYQIVEPFLHGGKPDARIPIYLRTLQDFKLPDSISTNIIMIATGTGIAPFLSFLEQRKFDLETNDHIGNITLYYGCRYSNKDFLFQNEIEKYLETGIIKKLYTSFSRENNQFNIKYVQDNILKNQKEFIEEFKNNCITYVCGKIQMCKDVYQTIISCYSNVENISIQNAENALKNLKKTKNYIEDVWT